MFWKSRLPLILSLSWLESLRGKRIPLRVFNSWKQLGVRRTSSTQDLGEGMSEQLFCARSVLGLHEDAAEEVSRVLQDMRGKLGVGGLSGDLKYGCHGLEFSPRGLFRQHLHHGAAETPVHTKLG